jgi:hypothetical protein
MVAIERPLRNAEAGCESMQFFVRHIADQVAPELTSQPPLRRINQDRHAPNHTALERSRGSPVGTYLMSTSLWRDLIAVISHWSVYTQNWDSGTLKITVLGQIVE